MIQAFDVNISQAALDDLDYRLRNTRWPLDIHNDDWRYGFNAKYLKALTNSWLNDFDWRVIERQINQFDHYRVELEGDPLHFLHYRSPEQGAKPLLLTAGWPSTFWDMHKVIEPLANPRKFGGKASDAFDVVVPSLPGFGFSTPVQKDYSPTIAADSLHKLMTEVLGYSRYAASGGDLGSRSVLQLGHKYADKLIGIHVLGATPIDLFNIERYWDITSAFVPYDTPAAQRAQILPQLTHTISHACVQILEPQTLSYAMHDSPVGQLAWIIQRWRDWGKTNGDVESVFSREFLLSTATLFWVTESFASAARYYRNQVLYPWRPEHSKQPRIQAPTGITFLGEGDKIESKVEQFLSSSVASDYNIHYVKAHRDGGHFGYYENPEACIHDIRATFRDLI